MEGERRSDHQRTYIIRASREKGNRGSNGEDATKEKDRQKVL